MKVRAALLREAGAPLEVRDDIELAAPEPGEVLVRIAASGVCHSDVSVRDGHIPLPMPMVLGHEGAGIVERLGPDVHDVAVGGQLPAPAP